MKFSIKLNNFFFYLIDGYTCVPTKVHSQSSPVMSTEEREGREIGIDQTRQDGL